MAILNNLLVTGAARFLNTIYADNLQLDGTIDAGHSTTANAILKLNNKIAVRGIDTWLRINDTSAFTSGIYFGPGLVRTDGTLQVGSTQAASSLYANSSGVTFNKPVTANGYITAANILVTDTLRAAHYDLETVTVMGNNSILYVAPSIKFDTAPTTTITGTTSKTITLVHSSITSNTIAGLTWLKGAKVKISGVFGGVVSGTMTGTLDNDVNTTSNTMKMTVTGGNAENVPTLSSSTNVSGINVMMYERAVTSGATTTYPVGIYLTSLGGTSKRTYIDVYSGVAETKPRVRIGDLADLNSSTYAVGGVNPSGWGIYTDHGFFSGTLNSTSGKIGGWTISASDIHNGTDSMTSTTAGLYLGTTGIRNYQSASAYVNITSGVITAVGANISGAITATSGTFGTSTTKISIGDGSIYYGVTSLTDSSHDGFFLGSTGLRLGKGVFTVTAAGALTASSVTLGTSSSNNVQIQTANFTRTINGTSRTNLRLAIGSTFGVASDGTVYASSIVSAGDISIGDTSANNLLLGTGGIKIRYGTATTLASFTNGGITLGDTTLSSANEGKTYFDIQSELFRFRRIHNSDAETLMSIYKSSNSNAWYYDKAVVEAEYFTGVSDSVAYTNYSSTDSTGIRSRNQKMYFGVAGATPANVSGLGPGWAIGSYAAADMKTFSGVVASNVLVGNSTTDTITLKRGGTYLLLIAVWTTSSGAFYNGYLQYLAMPCGSSTATCTRANIFSVNSSTNAATFTVTTTGFTIASGASTRTLKYTVLELGNTIYPS